MGVRCLVSSQSAGVGSAASPAMMPVALTWMMPALGPMQFPLEFSQPNPVTRADVMPITIQQRSAGQAAQSPAYSSPLREFIVFKA